MTLQQLEYIVALDTHRHYVKAADECFVTQPTITLQVKKLEDEMGLQIFNRSKIPLAPTPTGEMVINRARSIIQEVKQLKEMLRHEKNDFSGEFKIGIIPTLSPYLVPKFTGSFIHSYPNTSLDINEMQTEVIIEALKNGSIDIGILVTPLNESFIREIPLYSEPFVYYGNTEDPLLSRDTLSPEDVDQLEGIWLLNKGHCFRNQVLNICKDLKQKKNIEFQSGSIETLKKMVDNYGGFTLIPEMAIDPKEKKKVVHFNSPKPSREVSLVVNKGFVREGLIDVLRSEILKVIPKAFEKNEHFIRVKWR